MVCFRGRDLLIDRLVLNANLELFQLYRGFRGRECDIACSVYITF